MTKMSTDVKMDKLWHIHFMDYDRKVERGSLIDPLDIVVMFAVLKPK